MNEFVLEVGFVSDYKLFSPILAINKRFVSNVLLFAWMYLLIEVFPSAHPQSDPTLKEITAEA